MHQKLFSFRHLCASISFPEMTTSVLDMICPFMCFTTAWRNRFLHNHSWKRMQNQVTKLFCEFRAIEEQEIISVERRFTSTCINDQMQSARSDITSEYPLHLGSKVKSFSSPNFKFYWLCASCIFLKKKLLFVITPHDVVERAPIVIFLTTVIHVYTVDKTVRQCSASMPTQQNSVIRCTW